MRGKINGRMGGGDGGVKHKNPLLATIFI